MVFGWKGGGEVGEMNTIRLCQEPRAPHLQFQPPGARKRQERLIASASEKVYIKGEGVVGRDRGGGGGILQHPPPFPSTLPPRSFYFPPPIAAPFSTRHNECDKVNGILSFFFASSHSLPPYKSKGDSKSFLNPLPPFGPSLSDRSG